MVAAEVDACNQDGWDIAFPALKLHGAVGAGATS
jgi:hypothetical protein